MEHSFIPKKYFQKKSKKQKEKKNKNKKNNRISKRIPLEKKYNFLFFNNFNY